MSTHKKDRRTTAPTYPDAIPVDQHLVIDRTEWVPGADPEPHLRQDGQQAYRESYYRCVKCGAERQAKRYFPDDCEGDLVNEG